MLRRIDLRGRDVDPHVLLPRAAVDPSTVVDQVRPVVEDVRDRGFPAVRDATQRFDGVWLDRLRVPPDAVAAAAAELDPQVRAALAESIDRVRRVHYHQWPAGATTRVVPGGTVTQRWVPVSRVGLYVPGGLAVYPSSVVMNVVPAQVAGVDSVAVASPPQRDTGLPDPRVLAACEMLGVDEVYAVGGAQAVALLAYGSNGAGREGAGHGTGGHGAGGNGPDQCTPVDLVTGPGNVYVTAAKRLVRGAVGVDTEAGPTEIAILADDTADPRHVAADLVSQAEHDPVAASVLITCSPALADAVAQELAVQVAATKHAARVTEALTGAQSGLVLVDDLEAGLRVADTYAAEHLEIQTRRAREGAMRVRHAGAVFVGPYSPVSLGDYCAGSNHVLPTGGCARHAAGLSVWSFLRGVPVVEYDAEALRRAMPYVTALAEVEDLPAHGRALTMRFEPGDGGRQA